MKTAFLLTAAAAGMMAAAGACAEASGMSGNDKCYGIAKANQNSCASATGAHSCKGQAAVDNDPGDFVYLAPVDCIRYEGKTTPPVGQPQPE